jgi:hypothetical protein
MINNFTQGPLGSFAKQLGISLEQDTPTANTDQAIGDKLRRQRNQAKGMSPAQALGLFVPGSTPNPGGGF